MTRSAIRPARSARLARIALLLAPAITLAGCSSVVLKPAGDVAAQQAGLVVTSTILMLLIIVPVMAATALFAWRYRANNSEARYEPDWDHSTQLELLIWAAPLLIIICLGALTWVATHLLDPYRPISRLAKEQPVTAEMKPLQIDVVALDWKWVFIYPEQGIATVNELALPVNRPVNFRITASSVMNSFYVPALAGQIYAMPGMETKLHAVLNNPGSYKGFSANYSGAGFSGMHFGVAGLSAADFDRWTVAAKAGQGGALDRAAYLELERPSENVPPRRFAAVDAGLYHAVVNMCVEPGKMCMDEMMSIDAKGGAGLGSAHNIAKLDYDKYGRRGSAVLAAPKGVLAALCIDPATTTTKLPAVAAPVNQARLTGAGLPRPGFMTASAGGSEPRPWRLTTTRSAAPAHPNH